MSSKSSNSLDKVPIKQSRKSSKAPSKKDDKSSKQQQSQDQQNSTINQSLRKEIDNLVNQSSLLLGSIANQGTVNNQSFLRQEDPKYLESLGKLQSLNFELDEMVKMSGSIANKFSKRDNQAQVVQNQQTGELLSQIDKALADYNKQNDAKSVQASFINPYYANKDLKSGVTSVVERVPSENPLSNEVRLIMKHEGIQTDQKENQIQYQQQNFQRAKSLSVVPKLQLPQQNTNLNSTQNRPQLNHNSSITKQNITQDSQVILQKMPPQSRFINHTPNRTMLPNQNTINNYNQSINQTSNNFMQTRGSLQGGNGGFQNYSYKPVAVKPKLLIQDFYRQNQTNISNIQEQVLQRTLASNQSYVNVYEQQRSIQQQQQQKAQKYSSPQNPYVQSFQNTFNPQRAGATAPVNPYHHQIRDTQSQRDNARILDGISTGRFSMNSQYQQQQLQHSKPINNLGQAINILMN